MPSTLLPHSAGRPARGLLAAFLLLLALPSVDASGVDPTSSNRQVNFKLHADLGIADVSAGVSNEGARAGVGLCTGFDSPGRGADVEYTGGVIVFFPFFGPLLPGDSEPAPEPSNGTAGPAPEGQPSQDPITVPVAPNSGGGTYHVGVSSSCPP